MEGIYGRIRAGEASAIVFPDAYRLSARQEFRFFGAGFADPRKKSLEEVHSSWLQTGDPARGELLIISELNIQPGWRGHRLSLQFVDAMVNTLGRRSWMTAIPMGDAQHAFAEEAGISVVDAFEKISRLGRGAGFLKLPDANTLVRPSDKSLPLPIFEEPN